MAFRLPSWGSITDTIKSRSSSIGNLTTGNIGGRIGTVVGGIIKQDVVKAIGKAQKNLFGNSMIGALIGQVFGDLLTRNGEDLQNMVRRGDPALNFFWTVSMPADLFPPGIDVNQYVEEVDFTMMGLDLHTVNRPERDISYARRRNPPTINITMFEDARSRVATEFLEYWKDRVSDIYGNIASWPRAAQGSEGYKKRVAVAVKGSDQAIVGFYVFIGVFPTGGAQYTVGSDSGTRLQVRQQFSVDWVQWFPVEGLYAFQQQGNVTVPWLEDVSGTGTRQINEG